MSVNTLGMFVL